MDSSYFSSYDDLEVNFKLIRNVYALFNILREICEFQIHKLMIQDSPRTEAYKNAILSNRSLFEGKTVLDVGTGTGILSIFCAQAGAAKVYAVEASRTAEIARELIEENHFSDIIEVCNCS